VKNDEDRAGEDRPSREMGQTVRGGLQGEREGTDIREEVNFVPCQGTVC
jgi:hypothetical protein